LCNTSLNFNGRGFINKIDDLSIYVVEHKLDGFVIEEKAYVLKSSPNYQAYLRMPNSIAAECWKIHI
jgi:predicted NodU family carbamoyl transferase